MKNVAAAAKSTTKTNTAPVPPPDTDHAPASASEAPASKAPASGTRPTAAGPTKPERPERRGTTAQEIRMSLESLYFGAVEFSSHVPELEPEHSELLDRLQEAFIDGMTYVRHLEENLAFERTKAKEAQRVLQFEVARIHGYADATKGVV